MKPSTLALSAIAVLVCLGPVSAANPKPSAADIDFFEKKVRPVLVEHCASCHGKTKARGGLRLDSRAAVLKGGESGPAVLPGNPDKSLLIEAVRHTKDLRMPKKGKLSDGAIADLVAWVQRGAPWPAGAETGGDSILRAPGTPITASDRAFWSFRPIRDPALPAVKDEAWVRKPLDRFVLAGLEAKGLRPVRPAGKRALIRRVTFDLIGLPPTPQEIDAFLADESPNAFAKVVDRLLASPHYGERWGRHWLDVARYGEDQAHTFQARLYPHGYRYRDWVIKALNDDMPYDRFIIHQIAGDLVKDAPATERLAALGFFATGPVYYMDAGEKKAAEAAELDDRIDTLSRGFLGLTVSCARCHDHKFDPISIQDYYSLAGVFRSTQYQVAMLAPPEVVARVQQAQGRVRDQESAIKGFLDEESTRVAEGMSGQVARYMVAAWKLQTRRNRQPGLASAVVAREEKLLAPVLEQWWRYLFRRGNNMRAHLAEWRKATSGLSGNADLSRDPVAVARVMAAANAFQADLQALLRERDALLAAGKPFDRARADRLREVFSPQGLFKLNPRQVEARLGAPARGKLAELRTELNGRQKAVPPLPPLAHSLTEGTTGDMRVYLRGNPHKEGDVAPRRFLRILAGDNPPRFTSGSGRLELARAIASKDNPLTARVMVNRVWAWHFGKGLVGTPSNFGQLGERPTHPELLDHLAARFIASGWSLKSLHREILLSATYQLGNDRDARNFAADPANRLYWRMDRRRLDVEAWRDSLLAVSGNLDRSLGGPSSNLAAGGNRRRTVYGSVSRHNLNSLLRLFDFPDPNLTSEKRTATTVPLQQLFVLNSDFMVEQARALVRSLPGTDDAARIRTAYLRLYGRPARDVEVQWGLEFLRAPEATPGPGEPKTALSPWEQYAQALLGANEFTFID
jgi:cytochrome c553